MNLRSLGYAIVFLTCSDCEHIIWPWQSRCRTSHTICQHAVMRAQYERNRAMTPAIDFPMWECTACGQVPA